jgi:hypothetical protein
MKKLKLDLDQLQVSSFVADKEQGRMGTVNGAAIAITNNPNCGPTQIWDSCYSCYPQHCQPQPISWDFNC